jgi:hypothetical protein
MKKILPILFAVLTVFVLSACSGVGSKGGAFSGFFQGYLHGIVAGDMPQSLVLYSGDDEVVVMSFDLYARAFYDVVVEEVLIGVKYSGDDIGDVIDSIKLVESNSGMVMDQVSGNDSNHDLYFFEFDEFVILRGEKYNFHLELDINNDSPVGEAFMFYLKDVESEWTGTTNPNIYGEDVEYKAVGAKVIMSETHKVD